MRIIGNIPHPLVKISVFKMNMKFAVKLEMGLLEQTFKIRESGSINGLDAVSQLIDDTFINQCITRFKEMNDQMSAKFN